MPTAATTTYRWLHYQLVCMVMENCMAIIYDISMIIYDISIKILIIELSDCSQFYIRIDDVMIMYQRSQSWVEEAHCVSSLSAQGLPL